MEQKLDSIDKRLASIDITLAKQETHLAEHMRRSEANEKAVSILQKQLWALVVAVLAAIIGLR